MDTILVTGGNGQLGLEINDIHHEYPNYKFIFTDISELDITNYNDVKSFVKSNSINIIINCAAYTNVDLAESEYKAADSVNNRAVANIANLSKLYNIRLVHISTDYVFDGNSFTPYKEQDETNPQNIYGKTKLDGELIMKHINPPNSIIIRTSWLYSKFGKNFYQTMLNLAKTKNEIYVVNDQYGSPTNAKCFAHSIMKILNNLTNTSVELYHYSNKGVCSWYEFAQNIFRINKIDVNLNPIKSGDFKTIAKRPKYSALDNNLIMETFNLKISNWVDSLKIN
tara:strand:+ start:1220 stop:2065 length:846 start_codon:yes stop_codon:yes gene_type:complete